MQDFRQLKVWEKAHALTLSIYAATKPFPKEERYGLVSQMRRSASSIATNICEGCCRSSDADFARFLQIALGSASELEYQLLLSRDLEYLALPQYRKLAAEVEEVKRMLTSLISRVRGKAASAASS